MSAALRLITVTPDELRAIVREAVREELSQRAASPANDSVYMTTRKAAELLQCSMRQVQKLAAAGKLASVLVGSERRFRRVDVDAYLRGGGR